MQHSQRGDAIFDRAEPHDFVVRRTDLRDQFRMPTVAYRAVLVNTAVDSEKGVLPLTPIGFKVRQFFHKDKLGATWSGCSVTISAPALW